MDTPTPSPSHHPPTPAPKHAPTPAAIDWRKLHLWEIQPVRDVLIIAAVVGIIYLGYRTSVVTVPVLLALLLAYLFEPLVKWVTSRRLVSRQGAAIGILLLFGIIVVVPLTIGLGFGVVQGVKASANVATNISRVQKSVNEPKNRELREQVPDGAWLRMRDFLAEEPAAPGTPTAESMAANLLRDREDELRTLSKRVIEFVSSHAGEIARWGGGRVLGGGAQAVGAAVDTLTSLGMIIFSGFLTAFFFYFFSTGWGKVLEFWEGLIPERKRGRVIDVIQQMDRVIAGFIRGRITICFILALYMTIAYWIAGVPAFLILGPILGALFIVPYVHAIGVPIAMLLLWFNVPEAGEMSFRHQWWWIVGAPIVIYIGAQLLDDWVLSPTIQGKTTDLPIPTILFASLAGGALGGLYGLLLAIPVAACIRILGKEVFWPRFREWAAGRRADFLPIGKS